MLQSLQNASDYVAQGRELLDAKDTDAALEAFKQATLLDPNLLTAYSGMGDVYLQRDQIQDAINYYNKALHHSPSEQDYPIYGKLGGIYFTSASKSTTSQAKKQHYEIAITHYSQAIKIANRYPTQCDNVWKIYHQRAKAYQRIEDYAKALTDSTQSIDLAGQQNQLRLWKYRLALLESCQNYQSSKQRIPNFNAKLIEQAHTALLEQYDTQVASDNHNAAVYMERANFHLRLQNYDAAMADLNWAILLEPANATAYYQRACRHEKTEDVSAALADLAVAIKHNPPHFASLLKRAEYYAKQGEYALAQNDVTQALQQQPDNAQAKQIQHTIRLQSRPSQESQPSCWSRFFGNSNVSSTGYETIGEEESNHGCFSWLSKCLP
jgi:tetratricopeptide (TPR) repeat protein